MSGRGPRAVELTPFGGIGRSGVRRTLDTRRGGEGREDKERDSAGLVHAGTSALTGTQLNFGIETSVAEMFHVLRSLQRHLPLR